MNTDILKHIIIYLGLCLVVCTRSPAALAVTYQSHDSIYQAARKIVASHAASSYKSSAEIKLGKLDSRLKLKRCSKPLQAFMPKGSRRVGKTTVGVKCTGAKPWSLHVPVTISVYKNVLVAARQLHKGELLSAADTRLEKRDIGKLPHGFIEKDSAGIGMKLKRRVLEGAVMTPTMLKKPQIISRGQKVTIMAMSGRMQVRVDGKALANGAVGDRIKVMNVKSKQKLEGVITASGVVKVDI